MVTQSPFGFLPSVIPDMTMAHAAEGAGASVCKAGDKRRNHAVFRAIAGGDRPDNAASEENP
jgi:hypothetical protein